MFTVMECSCMTVHLCVQLKKTELGILYQIKVWDIKYWTHCDSIWHPRTWSELLQVDLLFIWQKAITWNNSDLLSIQPKKNEVEFEFKHKKLNSDKCIWKYQAFCSRFVKLL